jgi:hypothetical protein
VGIPARAARAARKIGRLHQIADSALRTGTESNSRNVGFRAHGSCWLLYQRNLGRTSERASTLPTQVRQARQALASDLTRAFFALITDSTYPYTPYPVAVGHLRLLLL